MINRNIILTEFIAAFVIIISNGSITLQGAESDNIIWLIKPGDPGCYFSEGMFISVEKDKLNLMDSAGKTITVDLKLFDMINLKEICKIQE